jgi:hypothetical protein
MTDAIHRSAEMDKKSSSLLGRADEEGPLNINSPRRNDPPHALRNRAESRPARRPTRQFSLTRKRIRQIEVGALRKLREKTRCFYSELHHE